MSAPERRQVPRDPEVPVGVLPCPIEGCVDGFFEDGGYCYNPAHNRGDPRAVSAPDARGEVLDVRRLRERLQVAPIPRWESLALLDAYEAALAAAASIPDTCCEVPEGLRMQMLAVQGCADHMTLAAMDGRKDIVPTFAQTFRGSLRVFEEMVRAALTAAPPDSVRDTLEEP